MLKHLLPTIVILLFTFKLTAQTLPVNGDTLNYRMVGFSVPENTKAANYLLEIFENQSDEHPKGDLVLKQKNNKNRTIATVPSFGKQYHWHVKYLNKKDEVIASTPTYYFTTGYSETIDTNKYRLRIIDSIKQDPGIYVVLDFISVIYDVDGNPLWYLPNIPVIADKNIMMRDLKPTSDGTFTAVSGLGAYEFNYNGELLWSAPDNGKVSGDTTERYHHELTKLSNGHYMVCGNGYIRVKIEGDLNSYNFRDDNMIEKGDDGNFRKILSGNLIEYDSAGNVVWYWKGVDHYTDSDYFKKSTTGFNVSPDMHLNSFEFDEANNVIYMSYRNTNQVVKIEYPSGKILARYGELDINKESPFYGQHCIKKTNDNRLYLFNNNTRRFNARDRVNGPMKMISYVDILEEPATKGENAKKIWEFSCDIDTNTMPGGGAGGSVYMLENGNILTSMGAASRIFIVTPEKKVIWNALPQSADINKNWTNLGQYRTSYIKKEDLEKFIFNK